MTALGAPTLATGRWRPVAGGTTVAFTVRNFGLKKVTGTLPVAEAWVDVDPTGVARQVAATLDLQAVETGHARRDKDLQKPHLLDTANHPTLAFTGTPQVAPGGWTVTGTLAGRESTEVTLAATIESATQKEITVRASTEFDRRELGVRAPRFLIGRRLRVTVTATFRAP
jgi:polyisoprenoid-binding protein YceI